MDAVRRQRHLDAPGPLPPQGGSGGLIQKDIFKGHPTQGDGQVFFCFGEVGLPQGEISFAQVIFDSQDFRQGLRAAILQLGQGLADQIPHGFGGQPRQRPVYGQDAPLADDHGADQADFALLIPVHPAIEGEAVLLVNLGLQPGLIEPHHLNAAAFVQQPQRYRSQPPEAAEPGIGLGPSADADLLSGGDILDGGEGGGILIAQGQGRQQIGHRADARLVQRFQSGAAQPPQVT